MEAPPKIYVTIGMGGFEKLAFKQVTEQDTPYIRLDLHEAELSRRPGNWLVSAMNQKVAELEAESQRLREALEYAICKHCHDPYPYHRDTCPVPEVLFKGDISPSAPAEPIEHPVPNNHRAIEGEWREFVLSPENPVQMGDQWAYWDFDTVTWEDWREDNKPNLSEAYSGMICRRFHPATNQEAGHE